ncbi:hypothetical protein ACQEVG_21940 [Streptomyces sp. CA-135486]|uniref:hypothetical protein n=1 Tax=Streptomyces sp. CA-135486 TaxID=3240049 RepID=UPI003D8C5CBB
MSHARHLDITGDISAAELEAHLDGHSIETIGIADNKLLTDLAFLRCCGARLKQVAIRRCPTVESLTFLPELDALEVVDLDAVRVSAVDVGAMARISRLRSVFISYPSMEEEELNLTPLRAVAGLKLNVSGLPKRQIIGYR